MSTTAFATRDRQPIDLSALLRILRLKYGSFRNLGPGPQQRLQHRYFLPAEHYETLLNTLVTPQTRWLDVGGGRSMFPHNAPLAQMLTNRAAHLVAVDPSENVHDNHLADERHQCLLEDYQTNQRFDLATLRMVAEHVEQPDALLDRLSALLAPHGRVVVFTVHRWSPVTLLSRLLPFTWHHRLKKHFWGGQEADTFPTRYRMNTRRTLARQFAAAGFVEEHFAYLDDLSVLSQFSLGHRLELKLWRILQIVGLRYPECCLLGVYRKTQNDAAVTGETGE